MSALEPLEHSVAKVILGRSSRKKLSALEPLEHSVPDVVLERSSTEKLSALEPLEHSVPDVVLERSSGKKLPALEPLEHSVLGTPQDQRDVLSSDDDLQVDSQSVVSDDRGVDMAPHDLHLRLEMLLLWERLVRRPPGF